MQKFDDVLTSRKLVALALGRGKDLAVVWNGSSTFQMFEIDQFGWANEVNIMTAHSDEPGFSWASRKADWWIRDLRKCGEL